MTEPAEISPTSAASSKRRLWQRLAVAVVSLALCVAAAFPVLSGRTSPPVYTMESAERAIDLARKSGGFRWAPQALMQAEAAYRSSMLENRRQESRFMLLRDFSATRAALQLTEEKSHRAATEAISRRQEAKTTALEAIDSAETEMVTSEGFAEAMHLGVFERVLLQKAKIALSEARFFFDDADYLTATDRAARAETHAKQVSARAVEAASRYVDTSLLTNWRRMVDETVRWSRSTGGAAIVIVKDAHRLTLYKNGRPIQSYRADLGYLSWNDKLQSGDAATPEGRYQITSKKGLGNSTYYKALLLNYPNEEDRAQFESLRRAGRLPRGARLGGLIEIHGEGGRGKDWTKGCVALKNQDVDDLFTRVDPGTPVTIVGGDGNGGQLSELLRRQRPSESSRTQ